MNSTSRKALASFLAFLASVQPVLGYAQAYQHRVYVRDLVVSESATDPQPPTNGGNQPPSSNANLTVSSSSLTFPDTHAGLSSTLSLVVTNTGEASPLNITADPGFTATHNCGTLAKNASCTVSVSFQPQVGKRYTGALNIAPVAGTAKQVTLAGHGLGSNIEFSGTSTSFGSLTLGGFVERTLTLTNNGNEAGTVQPPVMSGPFSLSSSTCGQTLGLSASCAMVIRFTPTAVGPASATLTVSTSNGPITMGLSGTGTQTALSANMSSLNFGAAALTTTTTRTIVVTNTGNVSNLVVKSALSTPFAVSGCEGPLPGASSCTLTVTFSPTAEVQYDSVLSLTGTTNSLNIPLAGTGGSSQASTTPTRVDFGTVARGLPTTAKQVTIENTGANGLALKSLTAGAPFVLTHNCPAVLSVGGSCTATLNLTPTTAGSLSTNLVVATGTGTLTVPVSAFSEGAAVTVSPSSLDFGSVPTGTLATQQIQLTNEGNVASALTLPGAAAPFSVRDTTCTTALAAGASCSVTLGFSPAALTDYTATYTVSTGYSGLPVSMKGTGLGSALQASATSLNFSNVDVGSSSNSQAVSIINAGTLPVAVSSVLVSGNFSATTSCTGTTLQPGDSCDATVVFSPTASGARSGELTFQSAAGNIVVGLAGVGLQSQLQTNPGTVAFGVVPSGTTSSTRSVTISNVGNTAMTGLALSVDKAIFAMSHNCPTTLAAGTYCTALLAVTPDSSESVSGALTVSSSAANSPRSVALSVDGATAVAGISGSVAFGATPYGSASPTASATVTNNGNVPLTLTGVTGLTTPFTLAGNTCQNVAPGSNCQLTFAMSTSTVGTFSSTVSTVGAYSNGTMTLSGSVTGAISRWDNGTAYNFGGLYTGQTSTYNATLTNVGNAPGDFSSLSGLATGFTASTNGCSAVAPGASCQVSIVFAPTVKGAYSATGIRPTGSSDLTAYNTLSLAGTGLQDGADLSTSSLTFADTLIGNTSAQQGVLIGNTGNVPLGVTSVSASGPFSASHNCPSSVALGASCVVNVAYVPTAGGTQTGTLTVTTSAGVRTVSLSGYGIVPLTADLSASFVSDIVAPSGALGTVTVGDTKDLTVFVRPGGTSGEYLNISGGISGSTDFTLVSASKINVGYVPGGGYTYTPSSCTSNVTSRSFTSCQGSWDYGVLRLVIRFTPSTPEGARTATLSVSHNGANSSPLTLDLTATSQTLPSALLSTSTLAFGNVDIGASAELSVRLTNTGSATMNLAAAPVTTGSTQYSAVTNCGSTLAEGQFCDTTVKFTPTVQGSASASYLRFATDATGSPHTVALTGTGMQGYGSLVPASGSSADFTTVMIGTPKTMTYVFTNTGNKTITGVYAAVSGDSALSLGSVSSNTCGTQGAPVTLAANASCQVQVVYNPSNVGTLSNANLSITSTALNSPTALSLIGNSMAGADATLLAVNDESGSVVNSANSINGTVLTNPSNNVTATTTYSALGARSLNFAAKGSSNYIATASSTNNWIGGADFTMEAWIRPTGTVPYSIFSNYPTSTWLPNKFLLAFGHSSAVSKVTFWVNNYSTSAPLLASVTAPPSNAWTHVAVTRQGNTWRLFMNGKLEATATSSVTLDGATSSAQTIAMGLNDSGANGWGFQGQTDAVQVYKGLARYTADFTPEGTPRVNWGTNNQPGAGNVVVGKSVLHDIVIKNEGGATAAPSLTVTGANAADWKVNSTTCGATLAFNGSCKYTLQFAPTAAGARTATVTATVGRSSVSTSLTGTGTDSGTVLLNVQGEGSAADSAGRTTSVSTNVVTDNTRVAAGSSSLKFTATGSTSTASALAYAANSSFGFGSGDFTLESWVWLESYTNGTYGRTLIDLRPDATNGVYPTLNVTTSGNLGALISSTQVATSSSTVPLNQWAHVAWSRNSGVSRLFINGVLQATFTDNNAYLAPATVKVGSGAFRATSPDTAVQGSMDDVRIVAGAGLYTNSFTPPTGPAVLSQTAPNTLNASTYVGVPATHTVSVLNSGLATQSRLTAALSGTDASSWSVANTTCDSSLASGATCSYTLQFSPTSAGFKSATLTLGDGSASVTYALSGDAVYAGNITYANGRYLYTDGTYAKSCYEYMQAGGTVSGVYAIQPTGQSVNNAYCDMTTDGGGWTLVLSKVNGSLLAYSTTAAYNVSASPAPYTSAAVVQGMKFSDAFINAIPNATTARYRFTTAYQGTKYTRFVGPRTYNHLSGMAGTSAITSYNNQALTTGAKAASGSYPNVCGLSDYSYPGSNYGFFQTNGAASSSCSTSNGSVSGTGNNTANGWSGGANSGYVNMWVR